MRNPVEQDFQNILTAMLDGTHQIMDVLESNPVQSPDKETLLLQTSVIAKVIIDTHHMVIKQLQSIANKLSQDTLI